MKKLFLIALSAYTITAFAQPVIMNGDNIPVPGFSAPVSVGTPLAGIGSGGADQIWDFSSVDFTMVGELEVIVPAESPIGASFPTSNYAYTFVSGFSFFEAKADKMEVQAYVITTPGVGNDYTPNPRTILKFPFNFLESDTDNWQKVGDSPNNVVITYDGYGTLITPTKTYTDVIRIKEDYGGGAIDYQWYITDPLMSIFIYDHNILTLYYIDAEQNSTAINNLNSDLSYNIFPNPATETFELLISDITLENNLSLDLYNVYGQMVSSTTINTSSTSINVQDLPPSVYLYQLRNDEGLLRGGKLIVE